MRTKKVSLIRVVGGIVCAVFMATSARAQDWLWSGVDAYLLNGKVGIGTASPQSHLHVAATSPNVILQDKSQVKSAPAIGGAVSFRDSNGEEYGWFGDGSGSQNMLTLYAGTTHGLLPHGVRLIPTASGSLRSITTVFTPKPGVRMTRVMRGGPRRSTVFRSRAL